MPDSRGEAEPPFEATPVDVAEILVRARRLERESAALRAIMEHAPEASLVLLDRDFNFLFVNATYANACGMAPDEFAGKNHFGLFPGEDVEAIFREARDSGVPAVVRARPFVFPGDPEQRVTYWDWTLTPVRGDSGHVESLVFSLVDVTHAVERTVLAEATARIDQILHSTMDPEEIMHRVIVAAREASGVESVGVALRDVSGWTAYFVGEPLERLAGQRFGDQEVPVAARAASTRSTVIVEDVEVDASVRGPLAVFGLKSVMNVPLIAGGEAFGVLGFDYHTRKHAFAPAVIEFAERVAASLALALANARAFETQRREAELGDALNRLLTSFMTARSAGEVLQGIVDESVRAAGADYGVISAVRDRQWVVMHAFGRGGERRAKVRYEYAERPVIVKAAETRETQLVSDSVADPLTNKAIMRAFGIGAFAAVPLVVRSDLLGVLEIVYERRPVEFDAPLRSFLDRVAVAASVALEGVEASERDRRVSETLQSSLLVLPAEMGGIAFEHEYVAASDAARVGGDFYDVFECGGDLIGLTIGDIAGKGLNAAAMTSLVKNTVRARAMDGRPVPSRAVALADRVLFRDSAPEMFATVFFGVLDRTDGRLAYCNGGHAVAMIVRADGSVVRLPPNSPLVGALAGATFADDETCLEPGDVLFLYTDGLTEARKRADGQLFGEKRLTHTLTRLARRAPHGLAKGVIDTVRRYSGGALLDDAAILAVRYLPDGPRVDLQTRIEA